MLSLKLNNIIKIVNNTEGANMQSNIWLVRPMPHGTNQIKYFLEKNRIAIGYPLRKQLDKVDYEEIRSLLTQYGWEEGVGYVNTFVHLMKIGDKVVVPNNKVVFIGELVSNYIYEPLLDKDEADSGFPHQREVKWYFGKKPILRSDLSKELKASMRFPGAVADLTKHREVINMLLSKEPEKEIKDLSSLEVKAINVIRELLESDDPEIRLKAAALVLNNNRSKC